MIEKEIFSVLRASFGLNAILQTLKIFTFSPEEEPKPFVVYEVKDSGADTAQISLQLHSDYKGLAEVKILEKEIKDCLENQPHIEGPYAYVFKGQGGLKFNVKRFKSGD